MYKERNKKIKLALLKVYSSRDVSVKGGKGTATGWVHVNLTLDKPKDCQCIIETKIATWEKVPHEYRYRQGFVNQFGERKSYCPDCSALLEKEYTRLRKIVYTCGAQFSHYFSDDGYGTQQTECLEQIDIRV